jgi:hypothetical protein
MVQHYIIRRYFAKVIALDIAAKLVGRQAFTNVQKFVGLHFAQNHWNLAWCSAVILKRQQIGGLFLKG